MTRYRLTDKTVDTAAATGSWHDGRDTLYQDAHGFYLVRETDSWPKVRLLTTAAATRWLTVRGHTLPEELKSS